MPTDTGLRLTVRCVDALTATGRDTMFWDRNLPGFGMRVYRTGRKVYIAQARGHSGTKRAVVGRHDRMQPTAARRQAAALIVARIKAGEDAVAEPLSAQRAEGPTVAALARRWRSDTAT